MWRLRSLAGPRHSHPGAVLAACAAAVSALGAGVGCVPIPCAPPPVALADYVSSAIRASESTCKGATTLAVPILDPQCRLSGREDHLAAHPHAQLVGCIAVKGSTVYHLRRGGAAGVPGPPWTCSSSGGQEMITQPTFSELVGGTPGLARASPAMVSAVVFLSPCTVRALVAWTGVTQLKPSTPGPIAVAVMS